MMHVHVLWNHELKHNPTPGNENSENIAREYACDTLLQVWYFLTQMIIQWIPVNCIAYLSEEIMQLTESCNKEKW